MWQASRGIIRINVGLDMRTKAKTSTAAKRRYNEKTYTMLAAQLPKELVAEFKEKCKRQGVSQASVLKLAIEDYIG